VLFEIALLMELIVAPYFWILLWPALHTQPNFTENKSHMLGLVLDHSVPVSLLLIDFIFFNANPIVMRHLGIVGVVAISYLVTNMTFALTSGPVYP
jgi:hypothetical protein